MDDIARIVHKHDGIIWGEYVWSKFDKSIVPSSMKVRFLNLNIFGNPSWPSQFLMDMYERFDIVKITPTSLRVYHDGKEYDIDVRIHNALTEITFYDEIDFTVNLIDYTRGGFSLRKIPACLALEAQPYETVIEHIRTKFLKIVNVGPALENAKYYTDRGWNMHKVGIISDLFIAKSDDIHANHYRTVYNEECSICKTEVEDDLYARTPCMHVFHVKCLKDWYEKSPTCPMCREQI